MFNLKPRIYSLLVCSEVSRDDITGAWRLLPISHLAVHSLPVPVNMVLCANIVAPPGEYSLAFNIFHTGESERVVLGSPTMLHIPPGKNVEYKAQVSITLRQTGLYMIEASLADYDTTWTPIRITDWAETIDPHKS